MSFPDIANTATSNSAGAKQTTASVLLPSGIVSGNLLIVAITTAPGNTVSAPTGYTQLWTTYNVTGRTTGFFRWADGSEGSSQNFTIAATNLWSAAAYRITGADTGTNPVCGTAATGASSSPNPPSLDPATWGTEDTLWIEVIGAGTLGATVTAWSTNYTLGQITTTTSDGANGAGVGLAGYKNNAASDDPGTATISASSRWIGQTIAVRPSAGAMTADVPVGLMKLTGVSSGTSKSAAVPVGLMKYTPVSPTGLKQTPVPIALVDLLGVAPDALHNAFVTVGQVAFQGMPLSFAPILADVPTGLVKLTPTSLSSRHDASLFPVRFGIDALGPAYGPYYGGIAAAVPGMWADWTNAADAVVSDGIGATYPSSPMGGAADPLDITDFGTVSFSGDVYALKIEARVKSTGQNSIGWYSTQLIKGGAPVGGAVIHYDNQVAHGDWTWMTAGTHRIVDDFGTTLNASEIDTGFGVRVMFYSSLRSGDAYVDDIRITFFKEGSLSSAKSFTLSPVTLGLHGVAPSGSKQAAVSVGLLEMTVPAPQMSKSANLGPGVLEFVGVEGSSSKAAPVPAGKLALNSPAIVLLYQASVPSALVTFAGFDLQEPQAASVPAALLEFTAPAFNTTFAADLSTGLVAFSGLTSDATHKVPVPSGLLEFTSATPGTAKQVAVPAGLLEFNTPTVATSSSANVPSGRMEFVGLEASIPQSAQVPVALVHFIVPEPEVSTVVFVICSGPQSVTAPGILHVTAEPAQLVTSNAVMGVTASIVSSLTPLGVLSVEGD